MMKIKIIFLLSLLIPCFCIGRTIKITLAIRPENEQAVLQIIYAKTTILPYDTSSVGSKTYSFVFKRGHFLLNEKNLIEYEKLNNFFKDEFNFKILKDDKFSDLHYNPIMFNSTIETILIGNNVFITEQNKESIGNDSFNFRLFGYIKKAHN